MKWLLHSLVLLSLMTIFQLSAQDFDVYFEDKTLRLDFVLAGNSKEQAIYLDELASYPKWHGKTKNLSLLPLKGDGKIELFSVDGETLLYTQSFSTLFQEWLLMAEAKRVTKSFEYTALVPFPKEEVMVKVSLTDREPQVVYSQKLNPTDIFIQPKGINNEVSYEVIHAAKHPNAIQVAIVAEGYTKDEMADFLSEAKVAVESIFEHAPFDQFKEYFQFVAVKSASVDSGVSFPSKLIWKNTVLSSHFDTFYLERYLTTEKVNDLHDVLAGIPFEHIIILANTDVYGGGGIYNSYTLTTTGDDRFKPVVVHEFGHSFAGLADEYFYEGDVWDGLHSEDVEPWEENVTTLKSFDVKWQDLLIENTPVPTPKKKQKKYPLGVYEGLKGRAVYTSALDCRMKTNTADAFCTVCQRSIEKLIRFYLESK